MDKNKSFQETIRRIKASLPVQERQPRQYWITKTENGKAVGGYWLTIK